MTLLTFNPVSLLCDWPVYAGELEEPCGLVSPSSTVRSITKDLQHSLDLASATSGDKVVTAQVSGYLFPMLSIGAEHRSTYCCPGRQCIYSSALGENFVLTKT